MVGTNTSERFLNIKYSYLMHVADYSKGNNLLDDPSFAWWCPIYLRKWKITILIFLLEVDAQVLDVSPEVSGGSRSKGKRMVIPCGEVQWINKLLITSSCLISKRKVKDPQVDTKKLLHT